MLTLAHRTRATGRPRRVWMAAAPAAAVMALVFAGQAAAGPSTDSGAVDARTAITAAAPGAATQGFIMSDGRICDPIRHMGC